MNPITGQSCTGMSAALTVAFMNYEETLVFSHPAYFNAFSVFARTLAHLFLGLSQITEDWGYHGSYA